MIKTHQPCFTGSLLDRTDENRPRDEVIAAYRASSDARVMLLDQLDPVITPEGGLLWLPMATIEANAATLFLGLEAGAPRFAAVGTASIDAGIRETAQRRRGGRECVRKGRGQG